MDKEVLTGDIPVFVSEFLPNKQELDRYNQGTT